MEDFQAALYPKLRGCWNLHNALPKDMDFFLMESSISGVIGNAAQSAYAAGSTFMDAFAAYRNSLGLPAVTLDLGVITGIGYLSENKELAAAMQKQGFEGTDERTLLALIRSAILSPRRQGGDSQVVTGLGTWNESTSLGNFDAPLFSHFRRLTLDISAEDIVDAAKETRDRLGAVVTLDDAAAVVFAALAKRVADRLQMPVENISNDKTISEYGVDSLVAVEIRNWISKELKSTVPLLEIVANVSMLQLAGKIASRSELVKISNLE
jgi:acyl carrier protein